MLRRLRIKALAAVPVRKKPTQNSADSTETNNDVDEEKNEKNVSNINETEQEITKDVVQVKEQKEKDVIKTDTFKQKEQKEKDISSIDISEQEKLKEKDVPCIDIPEREAAKDIAKVEEETKKKQDKVNLRESVIVKLDSQELCSPIKSYSRELHAQAKPNSQKSPSPLKSDSQELHAQANSQKSSSPLKLDFQKLHAQTKSNSQELHAQTKSNSQELHVQAKPNSQESPSIEFKPDKITDQSIKKNISPSDVSTVTDIASPTKVIQNRPCFMRPTPRLDSSGRIRKNSIQGSGASASESEDEHSKRVASVVPNRVRNDSVCSVQSNKEININDNQNSPQKIKITQKRRTLVSESARKLAEARREFLLKHENRAPDRSQLKMYDLIYYNPVTNPMKKLSAERRIESITTLQPVEIPEEEDEDDPSAMPTPQVKVGPDGQLIIDEQSLVIEQTDARRDEEMMTNNVTIEDDNFHSGGFYKRHKRSKEWPKWETFKFYRVLNVVGTAFLLMQTLFPNRSRQEIKQKYKKEERVNQQLVEKALKYHREFDTDMLQEQLEMLQNLENIQNSNKKAPEKSKSGQSLSRNQRKRKRRLVAESIGECGSLPNDLEAEDTIVSTTNDEIDIEICSDINNVPQQIAKKKARRSKKRSDNKFDDYSSCTDADSDSSEEVYQLRPTRSGRLSKKIRKLQAPDLTTRNSNNIEKELPIDNKIPSHVAVEITEYVNTQVTNSENTETSCSDNIMSMIPNSNQIEPGALVIVSKESAENPGNTILQVYMVASNDSNTKVTSSTASGNQLSEPSLINQSKNTEPIDIVDDSEK
ncbi:PREDICTED: transcription factor TFIIIB component B'' homolog [Acromyrmex echinatior]|uniref:Transcription factor TFIIIB component B''-like protein n=1 Tax=Acromyrmex echinatior TaxID=103372 RepID=F4W692_ACREC|nr:PREDICTED: transcription factor TFIIIB component B'' homolog [Acromyrmex echinatior]XP_011061017.1 PREDICTED: transcription factor TFIIIB component B'' homolog [Acromyrmex echinatior]XP_011061028.1 PREDICTED: transcription factor TFIIIB component B'' homolog [Acromyrmex echinatior]EGI70227.1 Transcription factor TFIIIB component B''-like protein [Acromyrmex echinatior]